MSSTIEDNMGIRALVELKQCNVVKGFDEQSMTSMGVNTLQLVMSPCCFSAESVLKTYLLGNAADVLNLQRDLAKIGIQWNLDDDPEKLLSIYIGVQFYIEIVTSNDWPVDRVDILGLYTGVLKDSGTVVGIGSE